MKEGVELTCSKKKVVLEGCNGDWAQKRYFPTLVKEAAKGEIELWGIDIQTNRYLHDSLEIELAWTSAQNNNKANYLSKVEESKLYGNLCDADCVFVVVPDKFHSEIAELWLERLAPEGKIFIEKPLDASMRSALKLKRKMEKEEKKDAVFGFDHYLAGVRPFLQDKDRHLKEVGGIERVEFYIVESSGIPPSRVQALDKGVIFDLFCHALAIASALVEQNSIPSKDTLQRVKLQEVKGAQYIECPISGETFAQVKFLIDDVRVETIIGKYVDASDNKFMKVYGPQGHINLDFLRDKFSIFDSQGKDKDNGKLNPRHVESFLEKVFQEGNVSSVPGILSFEAAFEILMILDEAKMRVGKMFKYEPMAPIDEILEKL